MMPLCFPWARMHRRVRGRARSGCFWRGLITKSWKLIGCFLRLNAWRQIVTNVCDAVDRWRDACWHTENDKGLSNGYPHSPPFSCPVTKQRYIQMWRRRFHLVHSSILLLSCSLSKTNTWYIPIRTVDASYYDSNKLEWQIYIYFGAVFDLDKHSNLCTH